VKEFHEEPGSGLKAWINGHFVEISKSKAGGSDVFIDHVLRGNFKLRQEFRSGLLSILRNLRREYRLFLLSGDNDRQRKELQALLPAQNLHFNQDPKDKLDFIASLMEERGAQVMMVGDGLNDAGALQKSHVGIVLSENTNTFTPACDAILDATQFERLPGFLKLSRASLRIVYVAYGLAFLYNMIGLSYAVQGTLSPVIAAILMPLSSLTIVLFGVGMSSLVARRLLTVC
jgi:Cu+-exporting ATPase